jgi:hypothetical protein
MAARREPDDTVRVGLSNKSIYYLCSVACTAGFRLSSDLYVASQGLALTLPSGGVTNSTAFIESCNANLYDISQASALLGLIPTSHTGSPCA